MRLLKIIIHIKVCLALGPTLEVKLRKSPRRTCPPNLPLASVPLQFRMGAPPRWCVARGPHTTPKSLASEWEKEAGTAVKDPP